MADKDLTQNEQLLSTDMSRYIEIANGVYALVVGAILTGGDGRQASVDPIVGALTTITVPHHEIHEGETWLVSYKAPDGAPIADDGTIVFAIQTGANTAHIVARGAMGGDFESEILEGATIQAGTGTAMVPRNKNRVSGGTNTTSVRRDPTITDAGLLLENEFFPGGTGGNAVGGASGVRAEWILARTTLYLIRITNRAGNAQPASLTVEWYEE